MSSNVCPTVKLLQLLHQVSAWPAELACVVDGSLQKPLRGGTSSSPAALPRSRPCAQPCVRCAICACKAVCKSACTAVCALVAVTQLLERPLERAAVCASPFLYRSTACFQYSGCRAVCNRMTPSHSVCEQN
jgi:hypothetical protein